jgi:hypothetical protein
MVQPATTDHTAQLMVALIAMAGIIAGAVITGIYNLISNQRNYANDYFKTVVAKRIAAYEQLEKLIIDLKTAVLDTDKKPYHLIFCTADDKIAAHLAVGRVMNHALWLSDECFRKTQELNRLLFRLGQTESAIEFGKTHYQKIAQIRSELEDILAADMKQLHDVRRFLRNKKKRADAGFEDVAL